jgi:hypothetical protein
MERLAIDRDARARGEPAVITRPAPPGSETEEWARAVDRAGVYPNALTMRSLELMRTYEPIDFIARISPTPLLMIALGLTNWSYTCRISRAQALAIKSQGYVQAARVLGYGDMRIMFTQILPNTLGPIIVIATLGMGGLHPTGVPGVASLGMALCAAGYGALFGLFPIGWIILNAIFIYNLSVQTGQFRVLQGQIAGVSTDHRIQALLIAFSFGAFMEGAAGFGSPVAVTGALMIGLGFRPLEAAKLALIGNTAPVAYGALGTPLITLAKVTNIDLGDLSAMVGRQVPLFSVIVPFWLVAAQAGWREAWRVWAREPALGRASAQAVWREAWLVWARELELELELELEWRASRQASRKRGELELGWASWRASRQASRKRGELRPRVLQA